MEPLIREVSRLARGQQRIISGERSLWAEVMSEYLSIPGLVGFWPMSSVQRSTGNVYDLSGQGRTLSYNGNPTFNVYNDLVPYIDLDGTGDYLSRADETDLDILGTESIFASGVRGLTLGGWFWFDDVSGTPSLLSKNDNATAAGSTVLLFSSGATAEFRVYSGATFKQVTGPSLSINGWYSFICRFIPSSEIAIFANGSKSYNSTSIPASLNNSAMPFQIGARNSSELLNGRASLCFLAANAAADTKIEALFEVSRGLFGV